MLVQRGNIASLEGSRNELDDVALSKKSLLYFIRARSVRVDSNISEQGEVR